MSAFGTQNIEHSVLEYALVKNHLSEVPTLGS